MLILIKSIFGDYNLYTFAPSFNIMLKTIKLNTIALIFFVFATKVLAVNVKMVSMYNTPHTSSLLAKYTLDIQNGKHQTEAIIKANVIDFTNTEVCEEDLDDEEDLAKVNSFAIPSILYSCIHQTNFDATLNDKFNATTCNIHIEKYLALSTLRI